MFTLGCVFIPPKKALMFLPAVSCNFGPQVINQGTRTIRNYQSQVHLVLQKKDRINKKLSQIQLLRFHVVSCHNISHVHPIYYISYPSSHDFWKPLSVTSRISSHFPLQLYQKHHWADNCGAWLPMPTVPGLAAGGLVEVGSTPPTQDAWETTTPVIISSFSMESRINRPLFAIF